MTERKRVAQCDEEKTSAVDKRACRGAWDRVDGGLGVKVDEGAVMAVGAGVQLGSSKDAPRRGRRARPHAAAARPRRPSTRAAGRNIGRR